MQMPLCLRSTFKMKYLLMLNWWHDCKKGSITVKTFFKTHYNVKHLHVMGLSLRARPYPQCPDKGKAGNRDVTLWNGFISRACKHMGTLRILHFSSSWFKFFANARGVLTLKMWWDLLLRLTNRSLEMFNKYWKWKGEEDLKANWRHGAHQKSKSF